MKGIIGEFNVRRRLGYLDKNKYTSINDVTIRTKSGKLAQIDHIVVSSYGVFVIETKNYTGKIYGNEYMDEWVQYFGKRRVTMYSPIKQNNGHILALKGLLGGDVKLISVIAFCKRADLNVTTKSAEVVYVDQLHKCVKGYTELVLSVAHVEEIIEKIESASLRGREVRQEHIEQVRKVTMERQERSYKEVTVGRSSQRGLVPAVKPDTCPKCGSDMIERTGKYGKYMGCSNYYNCKR